jgi:hypothetical protein
MPFIKFSAGVSFGVIYRIYVNPAPLIFIAIMLYLFYFAVLLVGIYSKACTEVYELVLAYPGLLIGFSPERSFVKSS